MYLLLLKVAKLMLKCEDADEDFEACTGKPWACEWVQNSTNKTSCKPQSCASRADSNICSPVVSADEKEVTLYRLEKEKCVPEKAYRVSLP